MSQSVFVAVPAYGDFVKTGCLHGLLSTQELCHQRGIKCHVGTMHRSDIVVVRNIMASMVLNSGRYTHLLFVDNDIAFQGASAMKLLDAQKPVIGCVYPKRQSGPHFAVRTKGDIVLHGDMCQVAGLGMGLCLIEVDALRKLTGRVSKTTKHGHGSLGPLYGFFDPVNDGEIKLSEDNSFCHRWITGGGEVWALTNEPIGHVGEHTYRGSYLDYLKSL